MIKEKVAETSQTTEIAGLFKAQSDHRWTMASTSAAERISRLRKLHSHILANRKKIQQALHLDFGKPASEVDITEIYVVLSEIRHVIRHLKRWMKPTKVRPTLAMSSTRSEIHYEPRGVVLIIAPWNYPFNLSLGPLVSAIAAGNCAIIKPSEYTPNTSSLIRQIVSEVFEAREVAVIEGAVSVSQALLELPFDHIFFTGSPAVGKLVMEAAARHLTSITLELGGKSPVIIGETANIDDAAQKIVGGKFANCGQTCVAPDYLLVARKVLPQLVNSLKRQIEKAYGQDEAERQASEDFARVVSQKHFARLKGLLEDALGNGASLEIGGITDPGQRYIAPTVLTDIGHGSALMSEEIFGPILPVLAVDSIEEAITIIQKKAKPLALYIFSSRQDEIDAVLSQTSAGGSCINEVAIQFLHLNLPFGGVNNSGIGNSHGIYGFKAFSHERAVLRHHRFSPLKLLFPPYKGLTKKLIDLTVKYL